MISPVIALLTDIVPAPAASSPAMSATRSMLPTNVAIETAPALLEDQDRRQLFVGHWNCVGTKSATGQGEQPYYGHLRNRWTLQNVWLLLHFEEYQPAQSPPFIEDQYWGFSENPVQHTRSMMTSTNGLAIVTAPGWDGDTITCAGTYTVGGITLDIIERLTILDQNQFNMSGEILLQGAVVGTYALLCTRQSQDPNGNTPAA